MTNSLPLNNEGSINIRFRISYESLVMTSVFQPSFGREPSW